VVSNRPDGEAPDQLPPGTARAAARLNGLTFSYPPVKNLNVTDDDVVDAFTRLIDELPRPILFYCRSGTRCTELWSQASAGRLGIDAVLAAAARARYDLEFLRETIDERAEMVVGTAKTVAAKCPDMISGQPLA
jgi:sulfide:quinone oxidoreductase